MCRQHFRVERLYLVNFCDRRFALQRCGRTAPSVRRCRSGPNTLNHIVDSVRTNPLSDSPQPLRIAHTNTAPVHLHDALVAPRLQNAVDRLAREPDELAEISLTESQ